MVTPAPPSRTGLWFRLLVVALILLVVAIAVWLVRVASVPAGADLPVERPPLVEPSAQAPVAVPEAEAGPGTSGQAVGSLRPWADKISARTGIPARALVAYGGAELTVRAAQPKCGLSWATLAAIGRVESDHGRYGGAVLGEDGVPSIPIVGVPLDGAPGVRAIADTDGGRYDGDAAVDRAVGPMQFIPSTWAKWSSDGNADGATNPQQIDDAALAAARYLCADGRNLTTPQGWWQGVFSYNNSNPYGQQVFTLADTYARKAARG
ncbi:murein transglycosylase [Actinokineospora auranticolor]|uniref:Transglycosylase protein with SLT domain n=1 Tax=Actinokineospora auranticolor TaxID=155976 RepID=A0A2S6GBV0_9PSEU|nr:murein transglycosylase [Actinokineospora auranticolor]PPK61599.1 transglycosylase protein with SLT domain [Actinokineospora auranticolor]